jgi:CBS domain-containing protein
METEPDGTPVTQLMTADVVTVTPDTRVTAAADTLLTEGIGSLVVVDDVGRLAGMFTTTDLAGLVAGGGVDPEATVSDYMTEDAVTIGSTATIRDAAGKMISTGVHHLPVTDAEEGVVGVISTMDLTAFLSYREGSGLE